jgi:hypothetical protein
MVVWARENGCPWSEASFVHAILHQNLDILRYMHNNGCPKPKHFMTMVARSVVLDIVKYFCEAGYTFDSDICCNGTEMTLETLIYLQSRGYAVNEKSYANAVKIGNKSMVKYLRLHGL